MSFFNKEYLKKYTVRVCHMFSVIALSGKVIFDYLFNTDTSSDTSSSGESPFYAIIGVIMIVSGTINTFLQKPTLTLKEHKPLWMNTMYAKFIITVIICSPIPKILFGISKEQHTALQFYVILAFIFISPYLRFYREHYTQLNQTKKVTYENMDL